MGIKDCKKNIKKSQLDKSNSLEAFKKRNNAFFFLLNLQHSVLFSLLLGTIFHYYGFNQLLSCAEFLSFSGAGELKLHRWEVIFQKLSSVTSEKAHWFSEHPTPSYNQSHRCLGQAGLYSTVFLHTSVTCFPLKWRLLSLSSIDKTQGYCEFDSWLKKKLWKRRKSLWYDSAKIFSYEVCNIKIQSPHSYFLNYRAEFIPAYIDV